MIKLKNILLEFKDEFGNEYVEHGKAYAPIDGKFASMGKQVVIFWKTKKLYDIGNAGDVKFIKKLSNSEFNSLKGTQYVKDAGIIKVSSTGKLIWEY